MGVLAGDLAGILIGTVVLAGGQLLGGKQLKVVGRLQDERRHKGGGELQDGRQIKGGGRMQCCVSRKLSGSLHF